MKKILRRIILYANLTFAIILAISYLSPAISPEKIWLPSFLGLAYPYILLVNLLFFFFWMLRKKKEFLISFLTILFGWNTLINNVSLHPGALFRKAYFKNQQREERLKDGQLKIMSFNVRAFDLYGWSDNPNTKQDIIALIQKANPEILCLQEFYSSETGEFAAEDIYRALDGTTNRHLEYSFNNRRNRYGNGIFSHFPMISQGRIELNNSQGICSYADLLVDRDTIRVYNLHLQSIQMRHQHYNFIDSLKFRYDNQQMEEIRDISFNLRDAFMKRAGQADRIADHIEQCPYPLIVCGDFNDTPVSYTYRRIRGDRMDAFVKEGFGMGRTYHGKFPSFRIDYILFGEEFETLHFSKEKSGLSDHLPITGYLRFL